MTAALIAYAALVVAASALSVVFTFLHLHRPPPPPRFTGTLTILKPCKGLDPDLRANLESWLDPRAEVLLGLAEPTDEAYPIAAALAAAHPAQVRLILTGAPPPDCNPKVSNLIGLTREAKGELLINGDSNVRAPKGLIDALAAPLIDPRAGASFALFVGRGSPGSLPSRLESLLYASTALPALAGNYRLTGRGNLIGKAMAIRRATLEAVGNWEAFRDVLVEDGALGRTLHARGLRVHAIRQVVEVELGAMSFRQLWAHETRWMLGHRVTSAWIPLLILLTNPWVLGLSAVAAALSGLATAAVALAAGVVTLFALKAVPLLLTGGPARDLPWLPVADAVTFAAAVRVWSQRTVVWRGRTYRLGKRSRILPSAQ